MPLYNIKYIIEPQIQVAPEAPTLEAEATTSQEGLADEPEDHEHGQQQTEPAAQPIVVAQADGQFHFPREGGVIALGDDRYKITRVLFPNEDRMNDPIQDVHVMVVNFADLLTYERSRLIVG